MSKPRIVIVTPALAKANNGNWQTAQRWANFMREDYAVTMCERWCGDGDDDSADAPADAMIALHARRSAASIVAWRQAHPRGPLLLVLTGTDLYRDIHDDAVAQHSLQLADHLIVLNEMGLAQLPAALRSKASICLQSSTSRRRRVKAASRLRALMVGHLRDEKSPQTYFAAARLLAHRHDIVLDHIGGDLDAALGREARALAAANPQYRWLGALPHAATRARIQAAHVLVHCSRMEGGAHVVIEAIVSGTPVLASRIDGNLGLLGEGYDGCFDWGDSAALAALLERCRDDATMLANLQAQCDARAPLFAPKRERQTLLDVLATLLSTLPATLLAASPQVPKDRP